MSDYSGPHDWRWELSDPEGRLLAGHRVRLDTGSALYEAFHDVTGYVRRHAPPDERVRREREILAALGAWIAAVVLGPVADALAAAAPALVRVVVPAELPEARRLCAVPLELARLSGVPLAHLGVSLVMEPEESRREHRPVPRGRPVRMLALFSQPEGSRALNLRRERMALTELFDASDRAVELRTLQYGVTRERLRRVLAEGWDVIHLSGHGSPGELLLETAPGGADRVAAGELVDLLAAADGVSLVTLSACWSAAMTVREQRRALDVPEAGVPAGEDTGSRAHEPGTLPGRLVRRLGCAVVALRYPVADDSAIALSQALYRHLLIEGVALPEALLRATRDGGAPLDTGVPALFGSLAAALRLPAPPRQEPRRAVPGPGDHFVGRVPLMTRAGAALAPLSGLCGVLLLGMPGIGKTACARELVATHAHAFDGTVWFTAPEYAEYSATDARSTPAEFAQRLEDAGVPGLLRLLDDDGPYEPFLAAVVHALEQRALLIVVDRADGLLTRTGTWHDERWARLLSALSTRGPAGTSRVVLTARTRPPLPDPCRLRVETVELLLADETLLLARELPYLARLSEGGAPGLAAAVARRRLARLLELTQGHPRLLRLADAQAADPERLAALLATAARAWAGAGGLPTGFFTHDRADQTADRTDHDRTDTAHEDYARVLVDWASEISGSLAPAARDLFHVLCCLEEADRGRSVLDHNWRDLRAGLGHGDGPLDRLLDELTDHGLLARRGTGVHEAYEVQGTVATDVRERSGEAFRRLVDTRLAGYWTRVFEMAWDREGTAAEGAHLAGPVLARAALSAAPYAIRLRLWEGAEALLRAVLRRDDSRATRARVLPVVRHLAALAASGTGAPVPHGALAEVLWATDPVASERQARAAWEEARARGDHAGAGTAAGELVGLCVRTGRLAEALAWAESEIEHAREAGLGPWTRLLGEVHRLHVLVEQGAYAQVVARAAVLVPRAGLLPRSHDGAEAVLWWEVWEELCDTAQRAAVGAEEWQRALEYNGELCASMAARGAPTPACAQARFPAYLPLLRLGSVQAALDLLDRCREVFAAAADDLHLGEVFGALATVEDARGRGEAALTRGRDCLRYAYRAGVPATVAVSHANFGSYLRAHARDGSGAVAHHVAAALLGVLTGGRTADVVGTVAEDLREFGSEGLLPDSPDALYARVGEVSGVDLGQLVGRLGQGPERVRAVFRDLVATARAGSDARAVAAAVWGLVWEPAVAALVSAADGNSVAAVKLRQHLARCAAMPSPFAGPCGALVRLLDGERDAGVADGLGPLDAGLVRRALRALGGEEPVAVELWPAMHLGPALGDFVAGVVATTGGTAHADLTVFAGDPATHALVPVLEEVLAGGREAGLAGRARTPTQRAVVAALLRVLGEAEAGKGAA
ncbi:CHAT domain-containing protein [Streptomyces sp. NPDC001941]|uniref:CHAT domain-containing protein n=1 Tax=Streptomyces sp. NPDC001941 TaxID=3154659 RepID=UPI00332F2DA3